MGEHPGGRWLNYSQAAKRVGRSERIIRLWRRQGMPMPFDEHGRRIVREDVLLAWFRDKLASDPIHQQRMRAAGLPIPLRSAPTGRDKAPGRTIAPASRSEPGSGRTEPGTGTSGAAIDPLADMKPLRGGPEYRALLALLREEEAGCRDVDAFTADRLEPEELQLLAGICAACPALEACRAFAAMVASR